MNPIVRRTGVVRLVLVLGTALLLVSLPLGCGPGGPQKGSVSGKVTYKGQPVPKGTITFIATSAEGRNATGELDPEGNYTLQTEAPGDGALLGDYNVTIYAHDEPILDYIPTTPVKPKILAPVKYEKPETSGLKATVKSGSNRFDFDLTDDGKEGAEAAK